MLNDVSYVEASEMVPLSVDLHLSKSLFSLDLATLQGWEHCSVVRSFVLSTNHITRCKRCRSPHLFHIGIIQKKSFYYSIPAEL